MRKLILLLVVMLSLVSVAATTLQGTIYNSKLEIEPDVLVEIDTIPQQQFLAKDGSYRFTVPPGTYTVTAKKGDHVSSEQVRFIAEGSFTFDIFLLPDFADEDDLWKDSEGEFLPKKRQGYEWWRFAIAGLFILFILYRYIPLHRKYGSVRKHRKRMKVENAKTLEQHKQEIEQEPGYVDKTVEIIRKSGGRISQKQLRREMLHLSESKISLILTELEHKGRIEKVKKGRGNVILLKGD